MSMCQYANVSIGCAVMPHGNWHIDILFNWHIIQSVHYSIGTLKNY